jgi:integrase
MSFIFDFKDQASNDDHYPRHRTVPTPESITAVPGYPSKLVVFKIPASRYWQVRCWIAGYTHRRSTKTTSLSAAQRFARWFYESLVAKEFFGSNNNTQDIDFGKQISKSTELLFGALAAQTYANEQARVDRGEFSAASLRVFKNRLDAQILPRFGKFKLSEIDHSRLLSFTQFLSKAHSTTTISHYLIIVRKILTHAMNTGLIEKVPEFPKIKQRTQSRGAFTPSEYWALIKTARALIGQAHPQSQQHLRSRNNLRHSNNIMPPDMAWAIGLMVNGFLRPGDLVKLKHRHIETIIGKNSYLRLTLPRTKLHDAPIVTLRPAVRIYHQICKFSKLSGSMTTDDYLLLPHIKDRAQAMTVFNVMFNWILNRTDLKLNASGMPRSLYSLRHSAITFRLLYGQGIDLITLARNARTSVEVINNHYASTVTGEQNIAMLQSKRGNVVRT